MADGSVKIGTELDKSGFEKGLNGLGSFAKKGFSAMGNAASAFAKAGTAAIGAVSASLAAAGTAAVAVGKEFETSFAKASTLFGDVDVNVDGLKKKILEVSDATGVAATELNESLYSALSAGIPVTEDMAEATAFLEGAAKLAKAGFTDMDTALSATAKTLNAYGLDVSEADRIQRILIQTQNKGITTVDELGASLSQVTPTAAAFGVSFENVGAALSNMTAQGTPTAQATTQLNALIAELGKSGTQGAKALEKAAKGTQYAGMSFSEMMAAGVPLNEVLDLLDKKAKDSGLTLVDMFSSIEAGKAALSMAGDNSEKFAQNLEAMGTSADVVGEAYDKVTNTLEAKVGKIQNSAKNLGIDIYNGIQEPLKGLADKGLEYMDQLADALKTGGVSGLIETGAGIVSDIALGISQEIPSLVDSAVSFLGTLIQSINDNLPQFMEAGGQLLNSLVTGVFTMLPMVAELGWNIISALMDSIILNAPLMGTQGASTVNSFLASITENIPLVLAKGTEVITSLASGISAALPQILPAAVKAILGFAQGVVNNLPALIDAGIQMLLSLAEGIANSLPTIIEMVPKLINSFADAVYGALPQILSAGVQILITLGKGIIDSIPTIIANAGEIIKAIINVISLANLASIGKSLINTLVNGIKGMKTAIVSAGSNLLTSLINTIKTTNFVAVGKNIILGMVNGIKGSAKQLVLAAAGAVEDALNWVKKKLGIHSPSRVMRDEVGKNIALGIAEGITANAAYAKKSMDEVADAILQAAKKKFENESVYREMSLADEVAYWDSVRKQVKEGTQAKIDADKEYFQKKKSLNQKMEAAEKTYTDSVKKVYEDLDKSIKSLWDNYNNELTSRTKDIMSSMGLFDEFTAKTELTTADLLKNLQSQVDGLNTWSQNLKSLERRGVSGDMLEELRDMGVDAAGEIALMNQMTDEELDQYISLWKQKQRIAKKEASRELKPLLEETQSQISQMRQDAQAELEKYKQQYVDSMAEIGVEIQKPLDQIQSSMLNVVSKTVELVAGVVSGESDKQSNVSKFSELAASILQASSGLPVDFSALGVNTVAGMIQGLQEKSGDLYAAMSAIIRQAVQTAKDELQIHSPSRLMRDLIGRNMIAGIEVGFELESDNLNASGKRAVKNLSGAMLREAAKDFVVDMQLEPLQGKLVYELSAYSRANIQSDSKTDDGEIINYKKMGQEMKRAMDGTKVEIDGQKAGKIVSPHIDKEFGTNEDKKERGY